MPNFIEIYKYFKSLPKLNQLVFIDMLKNLIAWIEQVEKMKEKFSTDEFKLIYDDMKNYMKEVWFSETSWFIVYKKVDYTSNKDIADLININNSWSISKMTLIRRGAIFSLVKNSFIEDLNVWIDNYFSEDEMIKEWFVHINENWVKKLDFKQLKVANEEVNLFWENFKLTTDNLALFVYLQMIEELRKYYWEDQLNEELNMDDSYKQIIFYKADKKVLEELAYKLNKDWEKDIIEKYEFKDKKLFINWNEFKINKAEKAKLLLEIISTYFSSTDKKNVYLSELDYFYRENIKSNIFIKFNENNIKTNYLKTIRSRIWKNYINNDIIQLKWNQIILN